MARKILIVGAGQSGLQLALGLQSHGYDITVMSARTPEEIYAGRVMSTQAMFHPALQHERDLGLNFWEEDAPAYEWQVYTFRGPDGTVLLDYPGRFRRPAQSVDQRVKMSGWLEEFENRGGRVVTHGVTVSDLDRLAPRYDLAIVAAGKGELVNMFGRDPARSPYAEPQRSLAVVYVNGLESRPEYAGVSAASMNFVAGLGEIYLLPALTTSGPCDIVLAEGVPGTEFDCFAGVRSGEEHLKRILALMEKYTPWEYRRAAGVKLTDWGGYLNGRFAPVVRYPVGRLPGGAIALGMADVVVANDPVSSQGANNAAHCAAIYARAILDHGDKKFDEDFMRATFGLYWEFVQYSTAFTNALLRPWPPHATALLVAGAAHEEIRDRFTEGLARPRDYFDWFMDADRAAAYLAEVTGAGRPA